jgi:hypothetical protein
MLHEESPLHLHSPLILIHEPEDVLRWYFVDGIAGIFFAKYEAAEPGADEQA